MAIQDFTCDTFPGDIGWIAITLYLEQGEIASSQSLLDPQLAHSQMADSSNAASSAYADGRGRVGVHADFHAEAEVQSPGLDSKRFGCALHQAVRFGFRGTEGHRALCA